MDTLDQIEAGHGRRMADTAFDDAAREIDADADMLRAIWQVEARGAPFDDRGRPSVLPERHKIYRYTPGPLQAAVLHARYGRTSWDRRLNYVGLATMDDRYAFLRGLRDFLASHGAADPGRPGLMGTSWGGPQIMGFNHRLAGFDTVEAMVLAFAAAEEAQLRALVQFLVSRRLTQAIREHDFTTIARLYNGPGQVTHYAGRMAAAYEALTGQTAPAAPSHRTLLRIGSRGRAVEDLQLALVSRGYHLGARSGGDDGVDGDFGNATAQAVRLFQHDHGLTADGIVGPSTRNALGLA